MRSRILLNPVGISSIAAFSASEIDPLHSAATDNLAQASLRSCNKGVFNQSRGSGGA
jgi:hypothetical protein